jgi:hypothetical protein
MKSLAIRCLATALPLAAATSTITSCIFDVPVEDGFFHTNWGSSEEPFEDLTIEFICDNCIIAKASDAIGSTGTYDPQGDTVFFVGLHLEYADVIVVIEEAHRTNDMLMISWHYSGSPVSYSTRLHRLK